MGEAWGVLLLWGRLGEFYYCGEGFGGGGGIHQFGGILEIIGERSEPTKCSCQSRFVGGQKF